MRLRALAGGLAMTLWSATTIAAPNACFAPDATAAKAGENIVRKGERGFDAAVKQRRLASYKPLPKSLHGAIRRVDLPAGKKWIALTFDLCEQQGEIAGYDGAIFDYLRQQNVKATLFTGGKWMRSHAERTQQLVLDSLFEMASHSDTHRNLRLLDAPTLDREIKGPQYSFEALREALSAKQCLAKSPAALDQTPKRISLFRFPFGACNAASLQAVNDAGLLAIQWDVSTADPVKAQTAEAIATAMIEGAKPGSIIIAHANGRGWNTAAAMPLAIPALKAKGFEFVTVSELLAAGTPVIEDRCYNVKPGDTDRYDFLGKPKPTAAAAPAPHAIAPPPAAAVP